MTSILTLARHAQTRDNAEGRWQGRRDSALTSEGRKQVDALGHRLKPTGHYAAIYTSPLRRAMETARLLSPLLGDVAIKTDARLAEYDFGAWDGFTPAELRARGFWQAVQSDPEFTPPQGEPFAASARRVAAALREIAALHPGERATVIGHGLTLAAALALLLEADPRHAPRYALDNGGIAELAFNGEPHLIHLDPTIS